MTTIIKNLKFQIIAFILLILLCLIVFYFNNICTFIQNFEFMTAILSGCIASCIIIIITEIQKYVQTKISYQNNIFLNMINLYENFILVERNIEYYLKNDKELFGSNFISNLCINIERIANIVLSIDYKTICTNQNQLNEMLQQICYKIINYRHYDMILKMAINEDKIEHIKYQSIEPPITSILPKTRDIMKVIIMQTKEIRNDTEKFINSWNIYCKNKYQWETAKKRIDECNILSDEERNSNVVSDYINKNKRFIETYDFKGKKK